MLKSLMNLAQAYYEELEAEIDTKAQEVRMRTKTDIVKSKAEESGIPTKDIPIAPESDSKDLKGVPNPMP